MNAELSSEEREIFENFRHGSGEGFASLFKKWYPGIAYFAHSLLKNSAEAEDITGDAFLKLWERRKQFISVNRCKSYLYTCVRNACLDKIRRKKMALNCEAELGYLNRLEKNGFFEQVLAAEIAKQLADAIESLPPGCRKIVSMVYREGKNNREVATELKLSANTIKNQKQRAISLLRKRLSFLFILPIL
jgi:RNA polymerase sigma-70 factor (family 1)